MFLRVISTIILLLSLSAAQNDKRVLYEDDTLWEGFTCTTLSGKSGTCMKIHNCPEEYVAPAVENICHLNRSLPIVCCADHESKVPVRSVIRDTELLSDKYFNIAKHIIDQDCRKSSSQYVAPTDSHSYMAAIGFTSNTGEITWECSGTMIAENFVITAAHCASIRGVQPDVVRIGNLNLLLGEQRNTRTTIDFDVKELFIHPDYEPASPYNDLVILRVENRNSITTPNSPVCIWTESQVPKPKFQESDYATQLNDGSENQIQFTNLSFVESSECKGSLANKLSLTDMNSIICAHDPLNPTEKCNRDKGGPLQFLSKDATPNRPYLVGITIAKFCDIKTPTVYTKLSSYIVWIARVIWPDLF